MGKIIKQHKRIGVGGFFGVFICILLIFFSTHFTSDFVANNLSPDGNISLGTIFLINFFRLAFGLISTIGLFFIVLSMIKPNIFQEFYLNPDRVRNLLKLIIFLFPIVFVICTVLIKSNAPHYYKVNFWKEDSIIEWLTFIFYFIAFIVSCSISISFYRSNLGLFCFMYILLSIGLFFVAMEEISWAQRIFNISTPELLLKDNFQEEMNIHNLKWFPLHTLFMVVGFYGAFSRFLIPKKVKNKYRSIVNLFVPDYYLFFYFFVVGAIYLYYDHISSIAVTLFGDWVGWGEGLFMHGKDQEPAEFLLACGFFLFVAINKYKQFNNQNLARVKQKNETF